MVGSCGEVNARTIPIATRTELAFYCLKGGFCDNGTVGMKLSQNLCHGRRCYKTLDKGTVFSSGVGENLRKCHPRENGAVSPLQLFSIVNGA